VFSLDLSFNSISTIERDTFRGLDKLEILHLEYNNISTLDPKLFADLMELKYLDLSHNNIQSLQFGTFNNLIQLKVLNISDNKLTSLQENGLLAVISLEEIVFHNNQISTLDVETLLQFKGRLRIISLNNNSWNCQEVANTYVKLVANRSLDFPGLSEEGENFYGIACTSKKKSEWEDSDMGRFFNEDFKKSKFFQYFEREYRNSDFFKFLDGYKSSKKSIPEKLVSPEQSVTNVSSNVIVFGVAMQVVIAVLLLLNLLRKRQKVRRYHA
jgi:Leucine-rich repeat (LRR) protein